MKSIINRFNLTLFAFLFLFISQVNAQTGTKYYLCITHDVADYETWKAGFDNHISVRQAATMRDIFVKRDINNVYSITALFEVKDIEKAKAFISDPGLKEAMAKAGVTSIPQFNFYKSAHAALKINSGALLTMVSNRVTEFSSWHAVHKTTEELRQKSGITDQLILQSLTDDNDVTVISTSSSLSGFKTYMSTIPSYWNTTDPGLNKNQAKETTGVATESQIKVLF